MSVTTPIFGPLLVPGITPQDAATSTTKAKITAARLAIIPLPLFARTAMCRRDCSEERATTRRASGLENVPHDVCEEQEIKDSAGDQARERQRILTGAEPQLQVDERPRDQREYGRQRAKAAELPRRQEDADGDRDGRLEHHRAGDVAERDDVLPLACPDEAVGRLRQLRGEGREDERDEERVQAHCGREAVDPAGEDARADED